jgi:ubiquinone/menaquinone biosynthesis C-methylase UbiE
MDEENYLARGFRDVDAAAGGKMMRCLQYLDLLPQFQLYKTQVLSLMNPRPGSITADLGCGLGFDVRRLAQRVGPEGTALGIDSSRLLLGAARSGSENYPCAAYVQADIRNLPFADGLLGSCKIDRVLQHVEQPDAVLREIFRTVTSGGTVVCAEPDWGTFAIEDGGSTVAEQIAKRWAESFQNPRIGRELRGQLEEIGFVQLRVREQILSTDTFESSDKVFDIAQTALRLAASCGSSEPIDWLARLRAHIGQCRCSVTVVINFAMRP